MSKKVFFYFATFLTVFIAHVLLRNTIHIGSASINVLLVMLVYISVFQGSLNGEIFGFAFGILADTFSTGPFGSQAFVFTLIGFLCGLISKKVDINQTRLQVLLIIAATLLNSLLLTGIYAIFSRADLYGFLRLIALDTVMNAAFAVPLYWVFRIWSELWSEKENFIIP